MKEDSDSAAPLGINAELQERFGDNFFTHHSVAQFTSTKLGGTVEYLVLADTVTALIDAATIATTYRVPFVVIGGGTGVLASDVGYPGVVIVNRTSRIMDSAATSQVVVDSGVMTDKLLNYAAALGLGGLEFLAAVPGTIGGAIATNAGYAGKYIKSVIKELTLFVPHGEEGQIISVSGEEITTRPYYRMFPDDAAPGPNGEMSRKIYVQPPVILNAKLQFSRTDQSEILRRLLSIRRNRQKVLAGEKLGQVFTRSLKDVPLNRSALGELKKLGALLDINAETIARRNTQTTASSLRQAISEIQALAQAADTNLDERVHFLGYWPDGKTGEYAENRPADAESF